MSERPIWLDAPDAPGAWWCWRRGAIKATVVEVTRVEGHLVASNPGDSALYLADCGEFAGAKWQRIAEPLPPDFGEDRP